MGLPVLVRRQRQIVEVRSAWTVVLDDSRYLQRRADGKYTVCIAQTLVEDVSARDVCYFPFETDGNGPGVPVACCAGDRRFGCGLPLCQAIVGALEVPSPSP